MIKESVDKKKKTILEHLVYFPLSCYLGWAKHSIYVMQSM